MIIIKDDENLKRRYELIKLLDKDKNNVVLKQELIEVTKKVEEMTRKKLEQDYIKTFGGLDKMEEHNMTETETVEKTVNATKPISEMTTKEANAYYKELISSYRYHLQKVKDIVELKKATREHIKKLRENK